MKIYVLKSNNINTGDKRINIETITTLLVEKQKLLIGDF